MSLLTAVYKFCCKGPICPSCPILLKLHAFGKSVMVNKSLEMNCQEYKMTYMTDVVIQPGNYSIDVRYCLFVFLRFVEEKHFNVQCSFLWTILPDNCLKLSIPTRMLTSTPTE